MSRGALRLTSNYVRLSIGGPQLQDGFQFLSDAERRGLEPDTKAYFKRLAFAFVDRRVVKPGPEGTTTWDPVLELGARRMQDSVSAFSKRPRCD